MHKFQCHFPVLSKFQDNWVTSGHNFQELVSSSFVGSDDRVNMVSLYGKDIYILICLAGTLWF